MKIFRRIVQWMPGTMAAVITAAAQTASPPPANTTSTARSATSALRQEIGRLIQPDAAKIAVTNPADAPETPSETSPSDVLLLERLDVRGERTLPRFEPPRETPMKKFLRTGTIMERGRFRLWSSGDAGIVLSLRF